MLSSLQVRNFALIENVTMEFGEGLNVLSGETGAGKSILVQAIELLLGGRGSTDLIRQGEEEAEVSGLFQVGGEEFLLRRSISRTGKNRAFLNERVVTVASLEEIGEKLVDLAGQHEHQVLLQPERHLAILDEYAGLGSQVTSYQGLLEKFRGLLKEIEELASREKEAREREEFFRFQLKELSEAAIGDGEEEKLRCERDVVKNAVRLGEICLKGEEVLDSGEASVTEAIARVAKDVQQAAGIDPEFQPIAQQIEEATCQIQEAAKRLRQYGGSLSFDPDRLQEIEDRLALISRLMKKYGGSLETMLQRQQTISESLRLLENFDEEIRARQKKRTDQGELLLKEAAELTRVRKSASSKLSKEVEKELKELGMVSAKFSVDLKPVPVGLFVGERCLGERGLEQGEFLLAPNPGEGLRPLAKIASGGELSRIFLALKKVLGAVRSAPTCIFDEVDVGIGGRIAEVVGRSLSLLAKKRQVVCITHLPQIACFADHHFVIQKRVERGRTQTLVERLEKSRREEEIARMLAGITVTDKAIAHAREMLKNAGTKTG